MVSNSSKCIYECRAAGTLITVLVGIQNVIATLENSWTVHYKIKDAFTERTKPSALCQVKEARHKRVHTVQSHLYEITEW